MGELLIENGADINAENNNGSTPLNYAKNAPDGEQTEMIELLLKYDAE